MDFLLSFHLKVGNTLLENIGRVNFVVFRASGVYFTHIFLSFSSQSLEMDLTTLQRMKKMIKNIHTSGLCKCSSLLFWFVSTVLPDKEHAPGPGVGSVCKVLNKPG